MHAKALLCAAEQAARIVEPGLRRGAHPTSPSWAAGEPLSTATTTCSPCLFRCRWMPRSMGPVGTHGPEDKKPMLCVLLSFDCFHALRDWASSACDHDRVFDDMAKRVRLMFPNSEPLSN